jgi:hypothetical protein
MQLFSKQRLYIILYYILFLTKNGWDTFRAIFSQTHLVTLVVCGSYIRNVNFLHSFLKKDICVQVPTFVYFFPTRANPESCFLSRTEQCIGTNRYVCTYVKQFYLFFFKICLWPMPLFLLPTHKHTLSQYTQQHCYVFPKKPYTLARFEPGCSLTGSEAMSTASGPVLFNLFTLCKTHRL